MRKICLHTFFSVAALVVFMLCELVQASNEDGKKTFTQWYTADRIIIQPESMKRHSGITRAIPVDYTLAISDRSIIRRMLSTLRENKLSYSDDRSDIAPPPTLAVSLQINGFWRNWWSLSLYKRGGCYPLTFQHNTFSKNELQVSYSSVSRSQLNTFLCLLRTASRRARHKEKGYTCEIIGGT